MLDELKRVQIRDGEGRPKHKLFQRLTQNTDHPHLREHLGSVVAITKLSTGWKDFQAKFDRIHPKFGETMVLSFDEADANDTGRGLQAALGPYSMTPQALLAATGRPAMASAGEKRLCWSNWLGSSRVSCVSRCSRFSLLKCLLNAISWPW